MVDSPEARFLRIYESSYPAVLAYCARRVGPIEAEETANDVFAVLWRHVQDFEDDDPLPWLYRVAYGLIRNRWRSNVRRKRLQGRLAGLRELTEEPADAIVIRRERDHLVLRALSSLSEGDQEVLRLSIWEELSAPGIAAVLECSVSAAEQRVHRAKKRLARSLRSTPLAEAHSGPGGGLTA